MLKKSKSKSYSYKEPEPKKKSTFKSTFESIEKAGKPFRFKSEEVKPQPVVKEPEECPCCKANCQCCFHLSGTGKENTCKCRCHYKEGHNY